MADKKTPAKKTPAKKTASTKRTTKKRKTSSNTTVKSRIFRKTWSIFWKLSLAVVIAMVLYLIYLDVKADFTFS